MHRQAPWVPDRPLPQLECLTSDRSPPRPSPQIPRSQERTPVAEHTPPESRETLLLNVRGFLRHRRTGLKKSKKASEMDSLQLRGKVRQTKSGQQPHQ